MSKPSSQTSVPEPPVTTGAPPASAEQEFELYVEVRHKSLVRRLFTIYRHVLGLSFGGLAAYVRSRPRGQRYGFKFWSLRLTSLVTYPSGELAIRARGRCSIARAWPDGRRGAGCWPPTPSRWRAPLFECIVLDPDETSNRAGRLLDSHDGKATS